MSGLWGQAQYALRVLRVALRQTIGSTEQLRFRLGTTYSLGTLSGWERPADTAYEIEISPDALTPFLEQPVAALPSQANKDVKKKADLSLKWIERAWFADEPLAALLYLFFALEALLGDKSEGLKSYGVAFRQAMLSHVAIGGFAHPNKTWLLYDEVRSGAVHGEDVAVSWDMVRDFAGSVWRTLNQYLQVANDNNIARRGRLLRFLDNHSDRPQLIEWLRNAGGSVWTEYLNKIDQSSGKEKTC